MPTLTAVKMTSSPPLNIGLKINDRGDERMTFWPWSKELEVGIAVIDEQHRWLVEQTNRLHEALQAGSERELIGRSEEHTSELQSRENLVCRLLLEKKNK